MAEGTHKLMPEQQDDMLRLYGVRYTHVETAVYGLGMNRKLRRKLARVKR